MTKKRREEESAAIELELMRSNQFKAKQYRPDAFEDWESIAEVAEMERTKRLAKRSLAMQDSARPPSMLAREKEAEVTSSRHRPNGVTKPDDKMKRTLGPDEVRAGLEKSQREWDKRMATTKETRRRERGVRDAPRNPLAGREAGYERKAEERRARKEERAFALEREVKEAERAKWERAMSAPVPEGVRMTKASSLKVTTRRYCICLFCV